MGVEETEFFFLKVLLQKAIKRKVVKDKAAVLPQTVKIFRTGIRGWFA